MTLADDVGLPETCEHCGGPLTKNVALLNTGKGCMRYPMPPSCPSEDCRRARDDEAIADAIARGVIDP